MAIKKCCDNCVHKEYLSLYGIEYLCCESLYGNEDLSKCNDFIPKEEIVRQQCINDFKEIINNINILTNFEGIYEDVIFNKAIEEYKKKLIERLEKYSKEK